jgi:type IV secretory pathway TraG/TraD family ATPase VirD4
MSTQAASRAQDPERTGPPRKKKQTTSELWPLYMKLLAWTMVDYLCTVHAFEGILAIGGTGSGKSSAVGKNIILGMLRAGFGMLVTTTKPSDVADITQIVALAGCLERLVVVRPDGPHRCNLLEYQLKAAGKQAANADNISALILRMLAVRDRGRGQPSDPFWTDNSRMALTNIIELLAAAGEVISFKNILRFLASLPESSDDVRSTEWQKNSYANQIVDRAIAQPSPTQAQQNDLAVAIEWAFGSWPRMFDKTRSGIRSTLESLLFPFQRNHLATLFGSDTTFVPDDCYTRGSIIVLALDLKTYLDGGLFAQVLFKTIWQQAMERRDTNAHPRPVCLFQDEFQLFLTDYDAIFQGTARSSRTSVVAMTQGFDSLISRFPGPTGRSEAMSLIGNFGTKIFCNLHGESAEIASKILGEDWTKQSNVSASLDEGGMSSSTSDQRRRRVEVSALMRLKMGGPQNAGIVEAYCFRNSPFKANGLNHVKVEFTQNPE